MNGGATSAALLTVLALVFAAPARAQAPSEAQREAIKSECRNDYMAHCSSIPPGGAASLECLQKNMASLSGACAGAVKAASGATETKAEPAPAAAEPAKAATEPAAKSSTKSAATPGKPTSAQISAIKANC